MSGGAHRTHFWQVRPGCNGVETGFCEWRPDRLHGRHSAERLLLWEVDHRAE
jgi:hypothetical protein